MSEPTPENDKDAPLTPEQQAVLNRARRSFMISMGLLVVGFIAIAGALVYRAARDGGPAVNTGSAYVIAAMRVPAGAEIVSATAADGLITLTYRVGAMTSVRLFDGRSGELLREVPIVSE
jgi:hypothetical protein